MKYWNLVSSRIQFTKRKNQLNLWKHLIKTYSNEGDTILDNAMGSGTTGIGCVLIPKESFIGIEIVEKYFKLSKYRITSANSTQ